LVCMHSFMLLFFFFFFFQAEDGIRDFHVTGVQTCALPILASLHYFWQVIVCQCKFPVVRQHTVDQTACSGFVISLFKQVSRILRSEERRVGKECRTRESPDDEKKQG